MGMGKWYGRSKEGGMEEGEGLGGKRKVGGGGGGGGEEMEVGCQVGHLGNWKGGKGKG